MLVPCVVCVSVPFTELHKCAYTVLFLLSYECVLFTNKVWELLQAIALPSFVHVSLSTSELHINVHIPIVFCCGAKWILFTNKLSGYWCHIVQPYLLTKFHTSKHSCKRVTQTCMSYNYSNVCVEVVFRGYPKSKVFTKNKFSYVGLLRLVRFNQKKKMNNSESGFYHLDTLPIVRNGPIFLNGVVTILSINVQMTTRKNED